MSTSNRKKEEQLGMPFGTACNRLRKQIMLKLLQQLDEDVCFRCSEWIETPEELSIEHKQDWLDIDPNLFWDLENIAFSHRACNRPLRTSREVLRKLAPEGTAWCNSCKTFRPKDKFHRHATRWNGVQQQCVDCKLVLNRRRSTLVELISKNRDL